MAFSSAQRWLQSAPSGSINAQADNVVGLIVQVLGHHPGAGVHGILSICGVPDAGSRAAVWLAAQLVQRDARTCA